MCSSSMQTAKMFPERVVSQWQLSPCFGGNTKIFMAKRKRKRFQDPTSYIAKVFNRPWLGEHLKEISILEHLLRCSQPNLLAPQVVDKFSEQADTLTDIRCILIEEKLDGTLLTLLQNSKSKTADVALALTAVRRLNSLGVFHRDIHVENIMYVDAQQDQKITFKMIDFECAIRTTETDDDEDVTNWTGERVPSSFSVNPDYDVECLRRSVAATRLLPEEEMTALFSVNM